MEKIKEKPSTNNVEKKKLSISEAIVTLKKEIPEDQVRLIKKQGALEVLEQIKE